MSTYIRKVGKIGNFEKLKIPILLFYYLYMFHNSYIVVFGFMQFWDFWLFLFLYLYILHVQVYYTCRSLTRVGLFHVQHVVRAPRTSCSTTWNTLFEHPENGQKVPVRSRVPTALQRAVSQNNMFQVFEPHVLGDLYIYIYVYEYIYV